MLGRWGQDENNFDKLGLGLGVSCHFFNETISQVNTSLKQKELSSRKYLPERKFIHRSRKNGYFP